MIQGRIQDLKLGGALKQIATSGAKIFGVFRVKNPPLWLPIITNLGSLSQIRLNEYQLKSISFNYNILYEKYSITQDKESMG